jgi:hypothetical protein
LKKLKETRKINFFGSMGVWTQDLTFARQNTLPLELQPQPFFLYFSSRASHFCPDEPGLRSSYLLGEMLDS